MSKEALCGDALMSDLLEGYLEKKLLK